MLISATSAASERNWSTYNFIHSKLRNRITIDQVKKLIYIYWNIRILQKLKVPLTVKELIKSDMNFSDLDKESDGEQNDDDFEVLTEYEENETDLDIDINEDLVYLKIDVWNIFFWNKNHVNTIINFKFSKLKYVMLVKSI